MYKIEKANSPHSPGIAGIGNQFLFVWVSHDKTKVFATIYDGEEVTNSNTIEIYSSDKQSSISHPVVTTWNDTFYVFWSVLKDSKNQVYWTITDLNTFSPPSPTPVSAQNGVSLFPTFNELYLTYSSDSSAEVITYCLPKNWLFNQVDSASKVKTEVNAWIYNRELLAQASSCTPCFCILDTHNQKIQVTIWTEKTNSKSNAPLPIRFDVKNAMLTPPTFKIVPLSSPQLIEYNNTLYLFWVGEDETEGTQIIYYAKGQFQFPANATAELVWSEKVAINDIDFHQKIQFAATYTRNGIFLGIQTTDANSDNALLGVKKLTWSRLLLGT